VGDVRRLIVFDLDGTLVDSERDLADAVNALLEERGAPRLSETAIAGMVGDGAGVLVRRACDAAGLEMDDTSLPRFLALYDERLTRTTRPYEGMVDALTALRRAGICSVLTNKPAAHTQRLLDELGLAPFFASSIGGDGPFPRKPDPAGLRHLMEQHQVPPDSTVLIGDSHIDAATAAAAGTHFCLAAYGFGARHIQPSQLRTGDIRAAYPADLPAAVTRLVR
jgi:phosphoglycolate phosphatase